MPDEHEIRIAETPAEQIELTEAQGLIRMVQDRLNRDTPGGNYIERKLAGLHTSWRKPKR